MNVRYLLFAASAMALCLTACGSGGGGASSLPAAGGTTPTAISQPIAAASGGSIPLTFPGGGAGTLVVPAGALSANATITVTPVGQAALGKPFQSGTRKAQSIPPGSTFVGGFLLDLGGATLYKRLTLTLPTSGAIAAGSVARLAMYSTKAASFTDVDTVTISGASASNDNAKGYVGISTGAGAANPYAVYVVPAANAATPAPITLSATGAPSGPYQVQGGTVVFTANGADANGNNYAFVPGIAVDGPTVGSLALTTTPPYAATLTLGVGSGNLIVTDAVQGLSKTVPVTILPQRPGVTGDTFTFTGTLARNDTYAYPSPTLPPSSANATVTQTLTTTNVPSSPFGSSPAVDFNVVEKDAYAQQTLSTTTDLYFLSSVTNFQLTGYNAVDDIGDTTSYAYTNPQTVDQLPELKGASWTNNPAATVMQVFAAVGKATRNIAADGSYTDNAKLFVPASGPNDYPAIDTNITENSDGSGQYAIVFHQNGRTGRTGLDIVNVYALSAPAATVTATFQSYNILNGVVQPKPAPKVIATYPNPFFGLMVTKPYTETNTNNGPTAIPANCNVPASLATTGNQIQQVVTAVDAILGTVTTTTTNQYVVGGFGPVCVQIAANIVAYYNYNLDFVTGPQSPNSIAFGNTARQTTTISETLSQPASSPRTQNALRQTSSAKPISAFAVANARANVQQSLERERAHRMRAIAQQLKSLSANGGVR